MSIVTLLLCGALLQAQEKGAPGPQSVPGLYAVGTIPPTIQPPPVEPDYAPDAGNEFTVYPQPDAADSAYRWEYLRIETALQEVPQPDGSFITKEVPVYSTSKTMHTKQTTLLMSEKGGLLGLMSILSKKRWQLAQVMYSPSHMPQRTTYFFKRSLK